MFAVSTLGMRITLRMSITALRESILSAWGRRAAVMAECNDRDAVSEALSLLDAGELRVAEKTDNGWVVNEWLKMAVLLSFRLTESSIGEETTASPSFDKVPLKFEGWDADRFAQSGIRVVPGGIVRYSAFIGKGTVLMPSFVNVGAYVGAGSMIDAWATVGSCAQIGSNCHISGGVGIGGVLEPLQANPVIIEDDCFIGARSEVAEGVIVEHGSVLAMGVFLSASTKIIDRASGEIFVGRVPAYSVVVPGTLPVTDRSPALACAVIVKRVDERTRAKTSINELLRD